MRPNARLSPPVLLLSLVLACSTAPSQPVTSSTPACTPAAFYRSEPHTALLGYRCSEQYAVATTLSATDGALYGGRGQLDAHLFLVRRGRWVSAVGGQGGLFIPSRSIQELGLDPKEIARSLGLSVVQIGAEPMLHVEGLGCDWHPSESPCAKN